MTPEGRIFWAVLGVIVFGLLARLWRKPYPIAMVLGGGLLALIPGLPAVQLDPHTVFFVMLPPVLFGAAWSTDFRELRAFAEPIIYLAVGMVVITTLVVAVVAHAWIGLPFAVACVLGAVLSPPDAIAVEAIGEEIRLPRRTAAVLSGESLINDATALVVFAFAVNAVLEGGSFVFGRALPQFAYVTVIGIGVGLAIAQALAGVQTWLVRIGLGNDVILVIISLMTPFLVYVPAEELHASGVLAVVAAGIALSHRSTRLFGARARIVTRGVWSVALFSINGLAFLMIGLHLRAVIAELRSLGLSLLWYGLGITALVIAVRFVMVFATRWALNVRRARKRTFEPPPNWGNVFIVGWAGMRGIVTLAAALSVPELTAAGKPFPGRALILFIAFCVIVVTLVGQGLTLPPLIRALKVEEPDRDSPELAAAERQLARAVDDRLRRLAEEVDSAEERALVERAVGELAERVASAEARARSPVQGREGEPAEGKVLREVYAAQRRELVRLREAGTISDRVYWRIEWEIDLLESRGR